MLQLNIAELYPTIEEFFAILGYDPSKKSIVISCDPWHKESLSNVLGLPTSIADSMIEGHMVNLHTIISQLIDKRTYGVTNNMQKKLWFGFMLYGRTFSLLWKMRLCGCLSYKCCESN